MAIDNSKYIKAIENAPAAAIVVVTTERRTRRYGSPASARRYLGANTYQATGVAVATEGLNNSTAAQPAPAPAVHHNPQSAVDRGIFQREAMAHLILEMGECLDEEMTELIEGDMEVGMIQVIAFIQEARKQLNALDDRVQFYAGQTWLERTGALPDGRLYEIKRKAERKAWKHDDWKHDARNLVAQETAGDDKDLAILLNGAMSKLQDFHGSTAPRVGTMKKYGMDPSEYCETTLGGWGVRIIEPSAETANAN